MDKSTKCAKILGLGQNKVSCDIIVKFLQSFQPSSRSVVDFTFDFYMEGPQFESGQMHIFYLHSYSAAKKVHFTVISQETLF